MRMQVFRTVLSGMTRGLLLFLPWATFRYFWLWQLPYDYTAASKHLTDLEFHTLEVKPGSDLYLVISLVGFAGGLSLLFFLRPGKRRRGAVWALAAVTFLMAALSTVSFPVLLMSGRLPGGNVIDGSIESIAWTYLFGLMLAWVLTVSSLWVTVAKLGRQSRAT